MTLLEVLNLLVKDGYSPLSYDVELHWYSAEEGGMLGSQPLAASYDPANVRAMLQMDMTAYVKPNTKERIGIIEDFVSPSLTEWIHDLIDEYLTIPSVRTKCGYACSDHSSWTKVGVPSAFAIGEFIFTLSSCSMLMRYEVCQRRHSKTPILGTSILRAIPSTWMATRSTT